MNFARSPFESTIASPLDVANAPLLIDYPGKAINTANTSVIPPDHNEKSLFQLITTLNAEDNDSMLIMFHVKALGDVSGRSGVFSWQSAQKHGTELGLEVQSRAATPTKWQTVGKVPENFRKYHDNPIHHGQFPAAGDNAPSAT